jgi:hypothetical protein
MHWFLQTTEKHLEWATCIKHKLDNYDTEYSASVKGRFTLCRDYSKIIFTCKGTALEMRTPPCMCARHSETCRRAHDHQGALSTHSAQAQPQQQVQREEAMLPLTTCGFLSTTIAHENI